ncbi:MAG TPA: nitronate monooxygenase, partial [Candidatus Limnocylindrales bacterium]|nr:nitronate monooxygenase [Candidatus Limnocylindrales bacterium]
VAVSEAGGLGSLGCFRRPPEDVARQLALIRERTTRPFAVNHLVTELDETAFAMTLAAEPPVISFALGDPGDWVRRAHDAGALVVHQVTTALQARQAVERGVDVIIAQGGEAGGYVGVIATLVLVPQVVDAVHPVPVVAAGGIADGRGLAAALMLGAVGVNVGTRFLASVEAQISPVWKQAIVEAAAEDAVLVEVLNDIMPSPGSFGYGTVLRSLRSPFIDTWQGRRDEARRDLERLRGEVLPVFEQMRVHELFPTAGQSAGLVDDILPAGEIVRRIVTEARAALERSSQSFA